jgi:catechol 2,3-dioxygenase-like lactoylglutathione lyase family enzyme
MSSSEVRTEPSAESQEIGTIAMKLEVVTLPVSDVDRAKRFYQGLGWRLDADFAFGDEIRAVQFTPPRSNASISFGKGLTTAEPGSSQRLELVVSDIVEARDDLVARGVEVSDLFHRVGGELRPGPDPERRSYLTYAQFSDPDGNGWLLQEVTARPSERLWDSPIDVAKLASLLHETAERHHPYEQSGPEHNWWDWYAAHLNARLEGSSPEEADEAAGAYMDGVLGAR